ncbi:MAG: radical SAM protein [Sinobacteraceae bacterium]|nr:radical SAM protein [Nevskiaceae bacterium]
MLGNTALQLPARSEAILRQLPLLTLYLTERCNSRCVSCDYWRSGSHDIDLQQVSRLLPQLQTLGTRLVVLSGGEPLLHPEWAAIASILRRNGLKVWLLTAGLALAKHAERAATLFDVITVSLDGTNAQTYAAIRGVDAFAHVCRGIRAAVAKHVRVTLRVTLQRANYRELDQFVALAHELAVSEISFLTVDVANPHAFGRMQRQCGDLALSVEDLPILERLITDLECNRAADFSSGFIAQSPNKLRRMLQYFAAVQGRAAYPRVKCNAPEFSAVMDAHGQLQPCFFIPGPQRRPGTALTETLNSDAMIELRSRIHNGNRPECLTCVCSLHREPGEFERDLQ